jgi:hypothetical protein
MDEERADKYPRELGVCVETRFIEEVEFPMDSQVLLNPGMKHGCCPHPQPLSQFWERGVRVRSPFSQTWTGWFHTPEEKSLSPLEWTLAISPDYPSGTLREQSRAVKD